jgi:phytoene dehydrogenase-like protein
MTDTWDYIVVGGGHNGLSAACTLAEANASVLVLDSATKAKVAVLPASDNNVAFFKIDMATSGRVEFGAANRARQMIDGFDVGSTALMTGTFDEQIRQLHAMRVGDSLEIPPVYMAVLSHHDRSLAPEGQDVVYICADVPAQTRAGWGTSKPWYSKAIMRAVGRHIDGLDTEIGRIETSPADFGTMYGTPNGSYFHVDMTPLRYGMNRPARGLGGYTTPVPRYYLAAAGAHPGGGVSGWAGRLAAQTALAASTGG